MVLGTGSPERTLTEDEIRRIVADSLAGHDLDGRHVVVIIPDGTRSAPMALMLRLLHDVLAGRARRIDALVALGTHQPMDDAALDALVGATGIGRERLLPEMTVVNHAWSDPATYATLGTISAEDVRELSGGRLDSPSTSGSTTSSWTPTS